MCSITKKTNGPVYTGPSGQNQLFAVLSELAEVETEEVDAPESLLTDLGLPELPAVESVLQYPEEYHPPPLRIKEEFEITLVAKPPHTGHSNSLSSKLVCHSSKIC